MDEQKTYKVTAICYNCLSHQVLTVKWGEKRPEKYICENCGLEVDTCSICSG